MIRPSVIMNKLYSANTFHNKMEAIPDIFKTSYFT